MSVPTTIFIDTSIFDGIQYHFESSSVEAFRNTVSKDSLTVLLPDSINRELRRHIAEKSASAVARLKRSAREEPFLKKMSAWPLQGRDHRQLKTEINRVANQQLDEFLNHGKLEILGYEGVDLTEVMDWHDKKEPPFSEKKNREFSDAFALAALNHYHRTTGKMIAVVAQDSDFKRACDRFSHLHFFPTLVSYSQAHSNQDERTSALRSALVNAKGILLQKIGEEFESAGFYHEDNYDAEICDIRATEFEDFAHAIIGFGVDSCTVVFDVDIRFTAHVSFDDLDSAIKVDGILFPLHSFSGEVNEMISVSGTLKLKTSENGAKIEAVERVELDDDDFPIREVPEEKYPHK